MFNVSEQIYANENGAFVASDRGEMRKLGRWGYITSNILTPDGNEEALKVLRDILPPGMTVATTWANGLGMQAVIAGERGAKHVPLATVATRYLELYADNGFDVRLAKSELKMQTVIDGQGNPGEWIKGIE